MSFLTDGITRLGLTPLGGRTAALEAFIAELELWNRRQDLVKASGEQLVVKHVFDSLAGVPIVSALPHATVADVGCGAGFPGIPLALFVEDGAFSLIERSSKRAAFLRTVVTLLDLRERVQVIERDLQGLETQFSVVTLRAFRDLPTFAPALFAITSPAGAVVAYKGKRNVVQKELDAIQGLIHESRIHPVTVPELDEERNIVVIKPLGGSPATGRSAPGAG